MAKMMLIAKNVSMGQKVEEGPFVAVIMAAENVSRLDSANSSSRKKKMKKVKPRPVSSDVMWRRCGKRAVMT